MEVVDSDFLPGDDLVRVDPGLHGKAKPRFSHTEMKVLLEAIKKNRYVLLRRFNNGVPAETKKNTWCEITAQINALGENQREVRQIMKKWADLKFDAKRRMRGPNKKNFRKKNLGPIEKAVHKLLTLNPSDRGNGDSDIDLDEDPLFSMISRRPDSAYNDCFTPERSSLDRSEGDWDLESPDYGLDLEEDDEDEDHLSLLESDDFYRSKPNASYSRHERGQAPPPPRAAPAQAPPPPHAALARCVRQQQRGRELLASVARSVQALAQSLQTMREKQQEFVRESLTLQRQTVETLRDFSNTALTMLQGAPQTSFTNTGTTRQEGTPQSSFSNTVTTRQERAQTSSFSSAALTRPEGAPPPPPPPNFPHSALPRLQGAQVSGGPGSTLAVLQGASPQTSFSHTALARLEGAPPSSINIVSNVSKVTNLTGVTSMTGMSSMPSMASMSSSMRFAAEANAHMRYIFK